MATQLREAGAEVTVTGLPRQGGARVQVPAGIRFAPLDVRDREAVSRAVEEIRPETVYHFAGLSRVSQSWEDPVGTFHTNLTGTLHVLEAMRRYQPRARFAFAGSGTEYGEPAVVPTPEESALRPSSPYASSKAAADLLCYQYFASFRMPIVRFRIFGTTGPGKRGDAVNDFASQIAALDRKGVPGTIRVGNLDKARDVLDVRDAVRAMVTVMDRGDPGGAYNIGSGVPRTVRSTLETLLSLARVPIEIESDPSRARLVDEPVRVADISRLRRLGWAPQVAVEQTLRDSLEFWRNRP